MASRRLNVLVYNGPGATHNSLQHVLFTLRRLLTPNYAVLPLSPSALLKEPWPTTCALLVLPGGADLPYCAALNGPGTARIRSFVERGGAYLGLCAGGYFASGRCEFEVGSKRGLEVVGDRELAFFPGTCRGLAFPGFEYDSEKGARAAEVRVERERFEGGNRVPEVLRVYYNGGGVFVDADAEEFKGKGVQVLARYTEKVAVDAGESAKDSGGAAAIVYVKVGQGHVVLTSPHPEFSSTNLEVVHAQTQDTDWSQLLERFKRDDQLRNDLMKACLTKLGLRLSAESEGTPSLTKLYLTSIAGGGTSRVLDDLAEAITKEEGRDYIKDENDTFVLTRTPAPSDELSVNDLKQALPETSSSKTSTDSKENETQKQDQIVDFSTLTKHIDVYDLGFPDSKETPYFNHGAFYQNLQSYYSTTTGTNTAFGQTLLYGEVVTSTNTLLEKNTQLLRRLPHGLTFAATVQVAGRGRGSNVWVSPPGSLMFSTVIRHEVALQQRAPVVFIQYLAAMAVVDAVRSYDRGYDGVEVRLKWPNDIYVLDPAAQSSASASSTGQPRRDPNSYAKIGGILVNSHYSSTTYHSVLGLGLNVSNAAPTTSLNGVLSAASQQRRPGGGGALAPYAPEKLLARILVCFSALYTRFRRTGFDEYLMDKYRAAWLHEGQIVTVESEGGKRCRICGITSDWGLLVAEEVDEEGRGLGRRVELQSDSNSFDFFKGLVRRKI